MDGRGRIFGHMPGGSPVEEITLTDGALSCSVLSYGGAVRTLTVPDRAGRPVDIVLGFDNLEDYRAHDKYMGALVGRCANRIGKAKFALGGMEFPLAANDGPNHLHGGLVGFDRQVWTVEKRMDRAVTLSLFSPDGQEGYPGNLRVEVTYTLQEGGLAIEYQARSDRDTVCNLTNHTYFNLSGYHSGPVRGQHIQILAEQYMPIGAGSIPTGALLPVVGTPMDLRRLQPIGAHEDEPFDQLAIAGGYDHNWAVNGWDGQLRQAARAWSPDTGISLEVWTTLPGVQFYGGNYLAGCPVGKGGVSYDDRWGFCLETQYFPDALNHPNFPSPILGAGMTYHSKTIYRFGLRNEQ